MIHGRRASSGRGCGAFAEPSDRLEPSTPPHLGGACHSARLVAVPTNSDIHAHLSPRTLAAVKRDEARAIWFWHSRLVIAIFPLLLIWAALRIRRTEQRGRAGWAGFAAWTVAGAIFTFSLLTGFSIGLFLLPVVAAMLYLAVRAAPDFRASLGFVAGVGLTLLVLASINNFSIGWLIPGVVFSVIAPTAEQVARRRHGVG